ncbi:DUF4114 domain-containing protein [Pedobacter sp. P351]|uniref:DUF4114 domain-containing protein n=1 Tax=Pedobacter superstes TaxID=3133441 RepID=UPI0030ACFC68
MKRFSPIIIIISIIFLTFSCKKNVTPPATSPVKFTSTTYKSLGTYDQSGKPNYLLTKDVISNGLLSFLNNTLPERTDLRKSNPELLTTKAIADIAITSRSKIFITFVSQATEFSNTIAFYTYPTNSPPASARDIKEITYIFPNAGSETPLTAGDKVDIGTFTPGTSVGFVLMKNGWNRSDKKINNDVVHFCSNDVLNPEFDSGLKKHAVLTNYNAENKVLIGFEDIDRTQPACDHDFNDVVVYASVTAE